MATLKRPDGLGDDEWEAIKEAEDRLLGAKATSDAALVVGSAKELCEAIAKVVIAERGEVPASAADLPQVITTAHKLLEYQPGEGLATDPEARKIAQGLKSIVLGLGEMRNRHGTGHGRPAPSGVTDEHAALSFDASLAWSGWALRRLEPYIAGDVTALVRDLEADIFHAGELARRLNYANLSHLPLEDQRRLGMAVARRAGRGTFVVRQDGVEAVRPEESSTWPGGYVQGLIEGMVFDVNGYLDVNSWKVEEAARLIAALPEAMQILRELSERVASALGSYGVAQDEEAVAGAVEAFDKTSEVFDEEGRALWLRMARDLRAAAISESS
jgi:hypothetical protein